jgi:methyltransferase (TIGR00027 family)
VTRPGPLVRNISDTARWAAVYRARETERPDALFRDPYARRLAGERGEQIADSLPQPTTDSWPWVTRTYLFDHIITEEVRRGADVVLNLAAGLDARPYRLELPPSLTWIEVDLPEVIAHKEAVLRGEKPRCKLERIALDLSQVAARRELFARVGGIGSRVLVVSEGLIIYLSAEEVGALATDLAAPASVRRWVTDLASPGLLRMLQRTAGRELSAAGAPLKFGPPEGPGFFARYGWRPLEVRSTFKTAARLGRLSLFMRLLALLPESQGAQGNKPWSGVCLLEKG